LEVKLTTYRDDKWEESIKSNDRSLDNNYDKRVMVTYETVSLWGLGYSVRYITYGQDARVETYGTVPF